MESIVITPRDRKEMSFIKELLTKVGLKSMVLSDEDKEDMGLAFLMSQADRSDIVDTEDFKKSLRAK